MIREWEDDLLRLDEAIRPIAEREVDLDTLGDERFRPDPLGEADIREEAQDLILAILLALAHADPAGRHEIRQLVSRYPSFFWAAYPTDADTPQATLRRNLLHFALIDQWPDTRDAFLWLGKLAEWPGIPAEDVASLAREVAPLASDEDRYGWGNTRAMLLRLGDWPRRSSG